MIRVDENIVRASVLEVTRYLKGVERKVIPAATVSALNKTANKARTDTVRAISAKYAIPQKILRGTKNRGRVRVVKATRRRWTAFVTAAVKVVKSSRLGKARQLRKGARAGKHFFPGSFKARMPSGHEAVFYRLLGNKSLPIAEEVVETPAGELIAQRNTLKRARVSFPKLFLHEINWRLQKLRAR